MEGRPSGLSTVSRGHPCGRRIWRCKLGRGSRKRPPESHSSDALTRVTSLTAVLSLVLRNACA